MKYKYGFFKKIRMTIVLMVLCQISALDNELFMDKRAFALRSINMPSYFGS